MSFQLRYRSLFRFGRLSFASERNPTTVQLLECGRSGITCRWSGFWSPQSSSPRPLRHSGFRTTNQRSDQRKAACPQTEGVRSHFPVWTRATLTWFDSSFQTDTLPSIVSSGSIRGWMLFVSDSEPPVLRSCLPLPRMLISARLDSLTGPIVRGRVNFRGFEPGQNKESKLKLR